MQSTEAMRYDSVNYPYFEQVREDIADIIEMGAQHIPPVDISLDEAYKKAVILNPTTATQLQQQSAQQQAVQKNQQAQRALTASSHVHRNTIGGWYVHIHIGWFVKRGY